MQIRTSNQHAPLDETSYQFEGSVSLNSFDSFFETPEIIEVFVDISQLDDSLNQIMTVDLPIAFAKSSLYVSMYSFVDLPSHPEDGINVSMYIREKNYPFRILTNEEIVQLTPWEVI